MIKFSFNKTYLKLMIIFFLLEIVIAIFVRDSIVRPFGGDALVVILIYCFIKSFFNLNHMKMATLVLLFAFTVEALQSIDYASHLGGDASRVLSILLGRTFS
jgi:Protein of unknown function (DUF2809)